MGSSGFAKALSMAALLSGPLAAEAQATQMNVAVQVDEICAFEQSRYYLSFGAYDPAGANLSTPADAETTIRVRCVGGLTAWVLLFPGNYPATGSTLAVPLRRMTNFGGAYLRYDLFQDAARTVPWAATSATAPSLVGQTGIYQSFVIYGRLAPGQAAPVGSYLDRVTINYTM